MKKLSLLFICLFISVSAISQSFQDEVNLLQSVYGMDKKVLLQSLLN